MLPLPAGGCGWGGWGVPGVARLPACLPACLPASTPPSSAHIAPRPQGCPPPTPPPPPRASRDFPYPRCHAAATLATLCCREAGRDEVRIGGGIPLLKAVALQQDADAAEGADGEREHARTGCRRGGRGRRWRAGTCMCCHQRASRLLGMATSPRPLSPLPLSPLPLSPLQTSCWYGTTSGTPRAPCWRCACHGRRPPRRLQSTRRCCSSWPAAAAPGCWGGPLRQTRVTTQVGSSSSSAKQQQQQQQQQQRSSSSAKQQQQQRRQQQRRQQRSSTWAHRPLFTAPAGVESAGEQHKPEHLVATVLHLLQERRRRCGRRCWRRRTTTKTATLLRASTCERSSWAGRSPARPRPAPSPASSSPAWPRPRGPWPGQTSCACGRCPRPRTTTLAPLLACWVRTRRRRRRTSARRRSRTRTLTRRATAGTRRAEFWREELAAAAAAAPALPRPSRMSLPLSTTGGWKTPTLSLRAAMTKLRC